MDVIIGSDHAGFKLKEEIKKFSQKLGYDVSDYGTNSEQSVDYPDIAEKVASDVVKKKKLGILICGSGTGVTIAANKIKGARAALCFDEFTAKTSREHNDANILCLAGRDMELAQAKKVAQAWLQSEFTNEERHKRRIEKVRRLETKC